MYIADSARRAWVAGIITSAVCLTLQVVFAAFKPKLRRLDQKILIQLTVARLVYSFLEYYILVANYSIFGNMVDLAVHYQMDAVVVCWMHVYAKNLRDQALSRLVVQKWNFTGLSFFIWILTIPVGPLRYIFSLKPKYTTALRIFLTLETIFVSNIVLANLITLFAIITAGSCDRMFANITKRCVISLILVCTMDTEVIMTTYFAVSETVTYVFGLLNSFQVLAVTMMFVIPAEEPEDKSSASESSDPSDEEASRSDNPPQLLVVYYKS